MRLQHSTHLAVSQRLARAIPDDLREHLCPRKTQRWKMHRLLPSILPGPNSITCSVEPVANTWIGGCPLPIPTFRLLDGSEPSLRIRANSMVQLIYEGDGPVLEDTPPMYVRSTRGHSNDAKYEIIELELPTFNEGRSRRVMYLHIPPPFLHEDIPISLEHSTANLASVNHSLYDWDQKEGVRYIDIPWNLREARFDVVLLAQQRHILARRLQRV